MSRPIKLALVAEGPTDGVVINAAITAILRNKTFTMTQLQPEASEAFGLFGGGWGGVYKWCKQAAKRGNGKLSGDNILFGMFDAIIIHLDADTTEENYSNAGIAPKNTDAPLPCSAPCPPANHTISNLMHLLLSWCNEQVLPSKVITCTPSKNTELWVIASLFKGDRALKINPECYDEPEKRLGQQKKSKRISKCISDYNASADVFVKSWRHLASTLSEAKRFQDQLITVFPA